MLTLSQFLPLIEICNVLRKTPLDIDIESSFVENGGDSLCAAALASAYKLYGYDLPRELILTSSSLRRLMAALPATSERNSSCMDSTTAVAWGLTQTVGELHSALMRAASAKALSTPSSMSTSQSDFTPHSESALPTPLTSIHSLSSRDEGPAGLDTIPDLESLGVDQDGKIEGGDALTRGQIAFLHGSLRVPGTNVIKHCETYNTEHIATLREAWRAVIESEPIFSESSHLFQDYTQGKSSELAVFSWEEEIQGCGRWENELDEMSVSSAFGSSFTVKHHDTKTKGLGISEIIWTVHHALVDGFSASLILDKVLSIANGMILPCPGPSFAQFARVLQQYAKSHQVEGERYWAGRQPDVQKAQGRFLLPSPSREHNHQPDSSASTAVDLTTTCQDIAAVATSLGTTRAVFFNAAWALTLGLYCDTDLVLFGAILSGRNLPLPGIQYVVGPLVNTLPLTVRLDREDEQVKDFITGLYASLAELESFSWTAPPQEGYGSSYESALAVQFELPQRQEHSIYPLARETIQETVIPVALEIEGGHQRAVLRYHRNRLSDHNAYRLAATFHAALALLLKRTDVWTVGQIRRALETEAATEAVQRLSNCTPSTLQGSVKEDLVTLFERQARQNPCGIAVERGNERLSYGELDRQASAVAARLSQHITCGDVVCVHADRSVGWLVAIFGVLKATGVYCPLDSGLPAQPRSKIFALSGAKCFVASHEDDLVSITPEGCAVSFSVDATIHSTKGTYRDHRALPQPEAPAYVCFTSGSTGQPKGVLCTHRGLVAFQSSLEVRLFAQPGKRIGQVMSPAFDGSIHELFSALTHGATLVLSSGSDPFGHLNSVDSAILTPSLAAVLNPADFGRLKWVYLVGEQVPQTVCDLWAAHKQLYNMYGPTEGTCGATIKRLLPMRPVTIGAPNPTTRVYILNSQSRPVPRGMVGEIFLAGVQIAKGYLNLPQQTGERFLPDSIWASEETMYRTGDRGYWDENGEVVCLGRMDREVKVRGFRLDLDDLEIRIATACPNLKGTALALHDGSLNLMVQPAATDVVEVRCLLSAALPHYAMPQRILAVEQLPLTTAGKVDYKKVGAIVEAGLSMIPAATETSTYDTAVIEAYRTVLQLANDIEVTPWSSFADLGGHSLQQLHLARFLAQEYGVRLSLKDIINQPTARGLALLLAESEQNAEMAESPAGPITHTSRLEKEWAHKYKTSAGSSSFNVCIASNLDEAIVDRPKLSNAWNTVLARHRLLSCRYVVDHHHGEIERVYAPSPPRVQCVDSIDLWLEANRPFDITDEVIRVFLAPTQLVVVLSHIIADYAALSILVREASKLYCGETNLDIPPRYEESSAVQPDPPSSQALAFWTQNMRDCPSNPALLGRVTSRANYGGTSILSYIHPQLLDAILARTRACNVTLQQMALAAVAAVLDAGRPGTTDIVVGAPYINRPTLQDQDTFGLFLEPLPIRIRYTESNDVTDGYLQSVSQATQTALAHAVPWHSLLENLGIERQYPDHPLFDVMVTVHDSGSTQAQVAMQGPGMEPVFVWSEGAKFKLLCEFTVLPGRGMVMRLEYDPLCLSTQCVEDTQSKIVRALASLASGMSHRELKRAMCGWSSAEEEKVAWKPLDGSRLHGVPVSSIGLD